MNHLRATINVWYHPYISRADGAQLLEGCEPGSFILRESSKGGSYALSVVLPNLTSLGHYLVEKRGPDKFSLQGSENCFISVEELLAHYHYNDSVGLPCRLRLPQRHSASMSSPVRPPVLPALPPRNHSSRAGSISYPNSRVTSGRTLHAGPPVSPHSSPSPHPSPLPSPTPHHNMSMRHSPAPSGSGFSPHLSTSVNIPGASPYPAAGTSPYPAPGTSPYPGAGTSPYPAGPSFAVPTPVTPTTNRDHHEHDFVHEGGETYEDMTSGAPVARQVSSPRSASGTSISGASTSGLRRVISSATVPAGGRVLPHVYPAGGADEQETYEDMVSASSGPPRNVSNMSLASVNSSHGSPYPNVAQPALEDGETYEDMTVGTRHSAAPSGVGLSTAEGEMYEDMASLQ